MAHEIKTITDTTLFGQILDNYFRDSKPEVRLSNGHVSSQFLGYNEGKAAFKVFNVKNLPADCLIITRKETELVYAHMKNIGQEEDQLFIFVPEKFQIIYTERKEERISTPADEGGKKLVFITNIISDFLIENYLSQEQKKIETIRDKITEALDKSFEYIRVCFASDGTMDSRMKFFNTSITPIFIPDLNRKELAKDEATYNFYINNIYVTDYYIKNHKYISEISVPLLYQMKMPYGYIQVNSTNPMNEAMFRSLKQFSVQADALFTQHKIFKPADERFIVTNISKKGFAIAFKERKFIRYFKENRAVSLDMILPGNKKASIYAMVRHITTNEKKIILIGLEILETEALGEVNYDEYIDSLK